MIKKLNCYLFILLLGACTTVNNNDVSINAPSTPITSTKTVSDSKLSVKEHNKIFADLKSRALEDDLSLNYSKLRKSYTETSNYRPYTSNEQAQVNEIFSLINDKNYQECLNKTDELLEQVFTSLGAHYTSVICAKELKDEEKSYLHEQILEGLLDSILKSGDGKSTQTAFVTYSSDELYSFLNLNGLDAKGQGVVNENGKVYDAMQVTSLHSEEEFTLYFDITTQWSKGFAGLE